MKRGLVFIVGLAVIISLFSFAVAQDGASADAPSASQTADSLGSQLSEQEKELAAKADSLLERDANLPEITVPFFKIIFGVKEPIKVSPLIITLMLWGLLYIIISGVLRITRIFSKRISLAIAFVMMILISLTGAVNDSANHITLLFGSKLGFLENWNAGAIILLAVVVIIGIAIASLIFRITNAVNREFDKLKAEEAGKQIRAAADAEERRRKAEEEAEREEERERIDDETEARNEAWEKEREEEERMRKEGLAREAAQRRADFKRKMAERKEKEEKKAAERGEILVRRAEEGRRKIEEMRAREKKKIEDEREAARLEREEAKEEARERKGKYRWRR